MNKKILLLIILFTTFISTNVFAYEDINLNNEENNNIESIDNSYYYINETSGYTASIDDSASLLSNEEKDKLLDKMIQLTEYGHIAFVSTNYNESSTSSFADNYYHSHYNTDSGTIFLIDMDNREIYIFSDGDNYKIITSSKAYSITDNIYRYATNREYYKCAYYAFDQINSLLSGNKIAEPMRFTSSIFVALALSFFISFIFISSKSRLKKSTSSEILNKCDIDVKIGEVSATKTGTHRVYSPVSDSSSGGGSSGGGGGGGSSGGGGGHSF